MTNARTIHVTRGLACCAVLLLAACSSRAHTGGGSASSETHFLQKCTTSCADGLSCVCGACTVTCDAAQVCQGLSTAATCVPVGASAACTTAPQGKLCDFTCSRDADCAVLGGAHVCESGRCRRAAAAHDAGTSTQDASASASGHDAAAAHDAGQRVTEAGIGCGLSACAPGEKCCPGCSPGLESCAKICPVYHCPLQDGGRVSCGSATCPANQVCCDHCTGSCVASTSGANCPDDANPSHACADSGASMCATQGQSCLSTACCSGFNCCSGIPIPAGQATCYANVGGCPMSDRNVKAGFSPVHPDDVLNGVLSLPLTTWHYKFEPAEVQHIGPMAQDFKAAFQVGADDKHIFQIDADGVSFAAIQALSHKLDALSASQSQLEHDNVALRERLSQLSTQLDAARSSCVSK